MQLCYEGKQIGKTNVWNMIHNLNFAQIPQSQE